MNLIDVIRELVEATETCKRLFGGNDCDGRELSEQVFDDEKILKAKAKGRAALAMQLNTEYIRLTDYQYAAILRKRATGGRDLTREIADRAYSLGLSLGAAQTDNTTNIKANQ